MAATVTPVLNYDFSTLLPALQIGLGMSAFDGERLRVAGAQVTLGDEKSFG